LVVSLKQEKVEAAEAIEHVRAELTEMVHRSLLQIGGMADMRERLRLVSERLSKVTPPAQGPSDPENHNPKPRE
jgi:hypothetical protein